MIAVIDYRAGNAPSVLNALAHLGVSAQRVTGPEGLSAAQAIVLPGVGSAEATMQSLAEMGLIEPLKRRVIADKTPFLGICIGLQVLFEHSEEGDVDCLGFLKGTVKRFPGDLRVPQMGWNEAVPVRSHPLWKGLEQGGYFYYVNSYYAAPEDPTDILAVTEYGLPLPAMVARDNIMAAQFHMEKSGQAGLQLLRNFVEEVAGC